MKVDANRLALAVAIVTAFLWVLCSAFVALTPGPAMEATGQMMHADLSELSWSLTWGGFVMGLVWWTGLAAVTAWLIARAYNRLGAHGAP